jgi:hypothetical protein
MTQQHVTPACHVMGDVAKYNKLSRLPCRLDRRAGLADLVGVGVGVS